MRKFLRKTAFRLFVILGAAWLGLCVLAYIFYPKLLYHPDKSDFSSTPTMLGAESYEEVWLTASDGVRVNAWFVPGATNGKKDKTILFFHGNAGNLSGYAHRMALYSRLGYDVLMVEYHGFGKSQGEPSEKTLYLDAEAAWRHLTEERGVAPSKVVIFGYSLGGAVAAWLAEKHPEAAGLILESTFSSLAGVASDFFPYLPCRLIVGNAFDTLGRLDGIRMPLLLMHGRTDQLIAYRHAETIFAAFAGPKTFKTIAGNHTLGYLLNGETYESYIEEFIAGLDDVAGPLSR